MGPEKNGLSDRSRERCKSKRKKKSKSRSRSRHEPAARISKKKESNIEINETCEDDERSSSLENELQSDVTDS